MLVIDPVALPLFVRAKSDRSTFATASENEALNEIGPLRTWSEPAASGLTSTRGPMVFTFSPVGV